MMAFDAHDLTPHEQFVVARTEAGEIADFTTMGGEDAAKPVIRAGFLRKLILQLDPSWPVRATGMRIRGARIEGALDLADCGGQILPALSLQACVCPAPLDLSRSSFARLSLRESQIVRVNGVGARFNGEVDVSNLGPIEDGQACALDFAGAEIGGALNCAGAKLSRAEDGESEAALSLDGAQVQSHLLICDGFECFGVLSMNGAKIGGALRSNDGAFLNRADTGEGIAIAAAAALIDGGWRAAQGARIEGEIDISGARIGAGLDLSGASARNDGGVALRGDNLDISGDLKAAARISGALRLRGAAISRNLDLRGLEIAHPLNPRGDQFGCAVDAADIRVGGAALFQGASVKGECLLAAARIEGYLAFGGGRFLNQGGWALRAPNARIGGNLTLKLLDDEPTPFGQKTVIEGGAKFDRSTIAGALAWANLEIRGAAPNRKRGPLLSYADCRIEGKIEARALTTGQDALIDLSGARCAALNDDLKSGWGGETAQLNLEGFRYGRLEGESGAARWRTRLAWLKRARGEGFSPQPFAQLTGVYLQSGRRDDARRVALEQHDLQTRTAASGPLTWALSSLFGLIAGYGLAPIRAARALALYLAIGVAGVFIMDWQGALVREDGAACRAAIEPTLYAMDVALPVLDLGQTTACEPGRTPRSILTPGIELPDTDWRLFEGVALWRWAQALYAVFGAILTALAILTFSGVMKPRDQN